MNTPHGYRMLGPDEVVQPRDLVWNGVKWFVASEVTGSTIRTVTAADFWFACTRKPRFCCLPSVGEIECS